MALNLHMITHFSMEMGMEFHHLGTGVFVSYISPDKGAEFVCVVLVFRALTPEIRVKVKMQS
jgi:hypothetical protein